MLLLLMAACGRSETFEILRETGGTLTVDQTELDFGQVLVGETETRLLTFVNTGNGGAELWDLRVDGDSAFATAGTSEGFVDGGGVVQLPVTFSPTETSTYSGTLAFEAWPQGQLEPVTLLGEGIDE